MHALANADFVNLLTVRAWGKAVPGSVAMRVDGGMSWPAWSTGRSAIRVRSPNILVSGYIVRRSTLAILLDAFARTSHWSRRCSVDLVLSRILYALASADLYHSYTVDATRSRMGHCAVSTLEQAEWEAHFPERDATCSTWHPQLYGRGSRSHTEAEGGVCVHDFQVPYDRVRPRQTEDGKTLVTVEARSKKNPHKQLITDANSTTPTPLTAVESAMEDLKHCRFEHSKKGTK